MVDIGVFKSEQEVAGLGDILRNTRPIVLASQALAGGKLPSGEKRPTMPKWAKAQVADEDLHPIHSILATVGWNKNDDVFDSYETWAARSTPEDKQFNLEHNGADIIGHITSSHAVDLGGNEIAPAAAVDDLPAKFHIVTGAVLYKLWEKPELQERMDRLLAEIAKGEWYVSMECYFKGFDYALQNPDGTYRIIARNDETAFMTKHLRAYGGSGNFEGKPIGRVLKYMSFSGKALVRRPANPASIILGPQPAPQPDESVLAQAIAAFFDDDIGPAEQSVFKTQPQTSKLSADIAAFFGVG